MHALTQIASLRGDERIGVRNRIVEHHERQNAVAFRLKTELEPVMRRQLVKQLIEYSYPVEQQVRR